MKKIKEIKRLVTDDKAVSVVIGTILMLSVTVTVAGSVSVGIAEFGRVGREMLDAQADSLDVRVDMIRSEIGVIERFTDYLDTLNFNISYDKNTTCNNTTDNKTIDCPLPDVEYNWNVTTEDWDVFMVLTEDEVLLQIYPPYLDSIKGEPIFPPPPDGDEGAPIVPPSPE